MSRKHYSIYVLILFLSSCSTLTIKSDENMQNRVNFSERIILAGLEMKTKSEEYSEKEKLIIEPSCVFVSGDLDSKNSSYDKFKLKLGEGVNKSAPFNEEQLKEAYKLLKTGQVKNDVKKTVAELIRKIPNLSSHMVSEIPNIFHNPSDVPKLSGINTAGETAKIFIKPENKTFRLAILAYARMNGININENNLDDLYNFLDSGNESDFDKLVVGGLHTMKEQYGLTDIEEAAQKFHSIGKDCMNNADWKSFHSQNSLSMDVGHYVSYLVH